MQASGAAVRAVREILLEPCCCATDARFPDYGPSIACVTHGSAQLLAQRLVETVMATITDDEHTHGGPHHAYTGP